MGLSLARATAGLIVLLGSVGSLSAQPISKPKLPYYDWGACPFECCTYRKWTTTGKIDLRSRPSKDAPVIFRIAKNVSVRGMTGVTITSRCGVTKMLAPMKLGQAADGKPGVSLKRGDLVCTLRYMGEGYDQFWYRDKVYSDQISSPGDNYRIVSRPRYAWWVKIKTRSGRVGWTDQSNHFAHQDACE